MQRKFMCNQLAFIFSTKPKKECCMFLFSQPCAFEGIIQVGFEVRMMDFVIFVCLFSSFFSTRKYENEKNYRGNES